MLNDAIVEEVRRNGQAFAARFNNDLAEICKALNDKERLSGRIVINRSPRRLTPKTADEVGKSPKGAYAA